MPQIYDRQNKIFFDEKVFGGDLIRWAYGPQKKGSVLHERWLQRAVSKIVGFYYDAGISVAAIPGFVRDYAISMDDFKNPPGGFSCFNDFFVRPYREGLRKYPKVPAELGAPAEGRLSIFPIREGLCRLAVKDQETSLSELYGAELAAQAPREGHAWVFRLCPVDYHCFHFPDAGRVTGFAQLGGALHSVNPVAQEAIPQLLFRNERHATVVETENFGKVGIVEVGAVCVGLIEQNFDFYRPVRRGQLKGCFKFGASTVVMITDADFVRPDADLLALAKDGVETLVRLGEPVGQVPA